MEDVYLERADWRVGKQSKPTTDRCLDNKFHQKINREQQRKQPNRSRASYTSKCDRFSYCIHLPIEKQKHYDN